MFTQIGLLDSLAARGHHESLSPEIKPFSAFESSRDDRSREYLTPLYSTTYGLSGSNTETVSAMNTPTVSNERPPGKDFIRKTRVIDYPGITTKSTTHYHYPLHATFHRMKWFSDVKVQPHEVLRPIGQPHFMLCSEDWLKETEGSDELEALRPVHVDRNPSVVLEDDFGDSDTDVKAFHENDGFPHFYSSDSIIEDAGIGSSHHENDNEDEAFQKDLPVSNRDPILRCPKLEKVDCDRRIRRNRRKGGRNAKRRRSHSSRNGSVRYKDVPLRYGRQSPARVQRILVEGESISTELIWSNRAKVWHDLKDWRKTNTVDLLNPELRAFLGVIVLVNGDGKPPTFHWEEATQMFSCVDEITQETAGISEDVLRKVISGEDLSITIDWKEMSE